MRRILSGALALWLAAACLGVFAPAVGASGSVFAGTWVSIDTDGSTQTLAVGHGITPAVTYKDFYASSCANDGAPSTHFVATGRGTVDNGSLWVDFRNGGCGRFTIGPFGLGFNYDSSTGTLIDGLGITWHRSP